LKEEQLIFIVSQPRAGSTYLQNLLSNNTEVNTCSEPWILLNFANQIKPELIEGKFDNHLAGIAFNDFLEKYPDIDFNNNLKEFILKFYEPLSNGFNFVIDKTPRYWGILDELLQLFPKSKIIILKRNPLDVAKSIIKTWEVKDLDALSKFKLDLLIAPKKINAFCIKNKNNPNVHTVTYEDLISDTIGVSKSIYEWIGIEFNDIVLNTQNNNKIKGIFGDPFQNNNRFTANKQNGASKNLKKVFEDFCTGYYNYLGADFLNTYGDYKDLNRIEKETISFKYFCTYAERPIEKKKGNTFLIWLQKTAITLRMKLIK
jgi:hypothetical protein